MSKVLKAGELEEVKIKKLKRRIVGLSKQAEKMFVQSIWGLVQALEAKDPYAKKHSENVTHYALGIAETMKIDSKQLEVIRRASQKNFKRPLCVVCYIGGVWGWKKAEDRARALVSSHGGELG